MKLAEQLYKDLQWNGKWVFSFSIVEEGVRQYLKGKKLTQAKKYRKATNILYALKKKGMIQAISQGLYVLIPYKYIGQEFTADKFHVAQGLMNKLGTENYSYVSHHSALELHGASASIFNYVYITSEKPFPALNYGPFIIRRVAPSVKWAGNEYYDREGMPIRASTQEVTFVDCIERLKYAGGLGEFSRSFLALGDIQSHAVVVYTLEHNKASLNAKVGFFLSILKHFSEEQDSHTEIEQDDITTLRNSNRTKKVFYLDKNAKSQVLVKEWNLIVPRELFELYPAPGGKGPEAR